MLFGYTVGESRQTSGWPNRLEKFCRKTGRSQQARVTWKIIFNSKFALLVQNVNVLQNVHKGALHYWNMQPNKENQQRRENKKTKSDPSMRKKEKTTTVSLLQGLFLLTILMFILVQKSDSLIYRATTWLLLNNKLPHDVTECCNDGRNVRVTRKGRWRVDVSPYKLCCWMSRQW